MKKILLTLVALAATLTVSAQRVTGTYTGELYIAIGVPVAPDDEPIPGQSIQISATDDPATVGFALYNFALGDMQLGDILLPAIGVTADSEGFTFADNADVPLSFMGGAIEATATLNETSSYVKGDSLYAAIDVVWTNNPDGPTPIYVVFRGVKPAAAATFDGSFDGQWVEGTPWDSENGYYNLDGISAANWKNFPRSMFIQPEGWCISNVIGISGLGLTVVARCDTVAENDYAVTLINTPNPFSTKQIVPAYITLGTSWATAKAGLFSISNADGGTFGGIPFTGQPDAVSLRYKRSHGTADGTEPASVIAYLWRGTYTQAKVPGNTKLGTPTAVDMIDRDRNILGMETAEGGEVTASDDAACVARLEYHITGNTDRWQELTVPFEYAPGDAQPEKLNIILSANDYFGDRNKTAKDDSLTVNDVRLVYYHALSALTYEGESLDFDPEVLDYDLSTVNFDPEKLSFEKLGRAATVVPAYDATTGILTLSVRAGNYAEDSSAVTVYTLRFAGKPNGIHSAATDRDASTAYTLDGRRVNTDRPLPRGVYIIAGRKVIK